MAGLYVPLPTLRRHPRGCLRTARGRCGSLFLHRSGLAPYSLPVSRRTRVKTFFLPQKLHATGRDPRRRDRLSIFLLSSLESIRAQPRTTLSDPNGHTARTTIHTPHARIAARSGLIPRRFITRVRL